jgi:NAD(P)-dependent dehydrogenase (short-subunit alcohol dehydrogenase family)
VTGALGGLRVLVHVAGGYAGGAPVESIEASTVRHMLELNLLSAFWAAKHAIPHVKRAGSGRLLFVSSRGSVVHYPGAGRLRRREGGSQRAGRDPREGAPRERGHGQRGDAEHGGHGGEPEGNAEREARILGSTGRDC